jgi:phage terminase large subunit GpA-like protein
MYKRKLTNISERHLIGELLGIFRPPLRMSTMDWGRKYRTMTSTETTVGVGNFEPLLNPVMEYVYDCLDNPYIPIITAQKCARIGWTEVINTFRGKTMHTNPRTMLLGFATTAAARTFAKGKWKDFLNNVTILREIVDVGVSKNKKSFFDYGFPNGELRLRTLGSISNVKSDNLPYIEIEEPDDARDDVGGQGDLLSNLSERQKLVPLTQRKLVFGGTPTHKDFSRVEKGVKASNQLVFKAECHECKELIPMDGSGFNCISYNDYQDRFIDDIYGRYDPLSAVFNCPHCLAEWTFEQKNRNLIAGKQYGFTDHTGNFSKGWHPKKPQITDNFGFFFSELLSPFPASSFIELSKSKILAELDKAKGKESLMKSYYNNRRGEPYASGFSAMEVEDMVKLRSNYPEMVIPAEGLVLTIGIDVQHNRFAVTTIAWGRNGNCWLVNWKEIHGNVFNPEDVVWRDLTEYCLQQFPHVTGKSLPVSAVSIDSGDGGTVELVYRWVNQMNEYPEFNGQVRACKGVRELRFSHDDIYAEPSDADTVTYKQVRRTVAETMGVKLYSVGAHRAHDEVLRRISLNMIPECKHDRFYFCDTAYGGFEEQILSCRKLIDTTSNCQKEVYKLISGKRKEAIDCCKLAFHAMIAIGLREAKDGFWESIESYLFPDTNK